MRDAKSMALVFPLPFEDEEEGNWLLEASGVGGGNVDIGDAAGNVDPPELDEAIDMDGTKPVDDDDAEKAVVVVPASCPNTETGCCCELPEFAMFEPPPPNVVDNPGTCVVCPFPPPNKEAGCDVAAAGEPKAPKTEPVLSALPLLASELNTLPACCCRG